MQKVKVGNKEIEISDQKAEELNRKYKKKGEVIKEFGLEQVAITIGGVFIGTVGMDMAKRIISDAEKE